MLLQLAKRGNENFSPKAVNKDGTVDISQQKYVPLSSRLAFIQKI